LAAFTLISIAVLILRKTRPDLKRGFRVPFVPVLPVVSVVSCLFLMLQLSKTTWIAFVIWLIVGLLIYFVYSRRNSELNRS
jgi:APA family basic amino acid/polyamine antiporter